MAEYGDPKRRVESVYQSWDKGIYVRHREEMSDIVARDDIALHSHANTLISSQVFGFNLFLPFVVDGFKPLEHLLGDTLGNTLEVNSLQFEYAGDLDVLAECQGSVPVKEEKFTSADVAISVIDHSGKRGLVLIEVKLSESEFTHCGGRASSANTAPEVCRKSRLFASHPTSCYLTRPRRASRDRRYWEILGGPAHKLNLSFLEHAFEGDCPFGDLNQLMRNHALAHGSVQSGEYDFWNFGLVYHDSNPDILPLWERYVSYVRDPFPFFAIRASSVIRTVSDSVRFGAEWARYMCDRYMLELGG